MRAAADQLKVHLEADSVAAGIIAVSVSRIFNPGTKIFVVPSERERERLLDRLEELMHARERDWRQYDLHSRITAVLFHIRTPSVLDDVDLLTTMSCACVIPTNKEKERFEILAEELPSLLRY